MTTTDASTTSRAGPGAIASTFLVGAAVCAAVNVVLGLVFAALLDEPTGFEPFLPRAAFVTTFAVAVLGGVLYAVLARLTRRPTSVWRAVAIAFAVVSLVGVAMTRGEYEGVTAGVSVAQAVLHLVPLAVLLPLVSRRLGDGRTASFGQGAR